MKTTGVVAVVMFVVGLFVGASYKSWSVEPATKGINDTQVVNGIGGVFFKAADPARLRAWYREHLGIDADEQGVNFFWREEQDATRFGRTVWSVFPKNTRYFGTGEQNVMINYRVRDLDRLLATLRSRGVQQVGRVEDFWYGRFAWVLDGEGNRIELWQPVHQSREEFDQQLKREAAPGR